MGIIAFLVLGALAGWIASWIMGTREGLLLDIVVGIIGAFIGGFVFNIFGSVGVTGFNLWSLLVAVIGAVILLWIVHMVRRA